MTNFLNESQNTLNKAIELLQHNPEWIIRYEDYAKEILKKFDLAKSKKKHFHEWASLYIYMNVSEAKGSLSFSLRYLGQDVAKLKVKKDNVIISTKGLGNNNIRDFGCNICLHNNNWKSKEAKEFRKFFSANLVRLNNSSKGNEEHRVESALLTEFSKKKGKEKALRYIQPVRLAGISRFQMPTPLSASKINELSYSGSHGGGIDILARVGTGRGVKLCIIEVKDENKPSEPPSKVIQQAIAYAVFIRELLRSKAGNDWYKIFGFKSSIPKKLKLVVVCAMPYHPSTDNSFANQILNIGNDELHLHYIYFAEINNRIEKIIFSIDKSSIE